MQKALALCICSLFMLCCSAEAATVAITADKDTYIDKVYPDVNFGQKWNMLVSGSSTKPANGLLHLDFSAVPDYAIIKDAKLTFLVHANHFTTKYFIHPMSAFWQEDATTWNIAQTGILWGTTGGDYDPALVYETTLPGTTPQWSVTDVTSLVSEQQGYLRKSITDYGLLIRGDAGYNKILSSEFSTYANALTCHSCHGINDPSLDVGKSTNCARCHSQGDIRLSGEPSLIINYEPMLFQFIQVSDIHIGKSPQQTTNLINAVTQINSINPAFVLFTGDLTDSGSIEQYTTFKTTVSNLSIPHYCVPGDNDIVDGEGDLQRYRDQLGNDYFALDYQGFKFIGLNNNLYLSLDQTQSQWFEQELQKGKPEIIFAHKPLLDYENNFVPFADAQQLLNFFNAYDVVMYMSGHWHESAEYTSNNTHHIWCDNLSFAHLGDTYNLYRVYADHIALYHVDLRDGSQAFAGSFPITLSSTLVNLSSLKAIPSNRRVTIRWATESEIDNAGFNIYRAEENGDYIKLNNGIISAQGSSTTGASYEFVDIRVQNRKTYSYKLEDIDLNGAARVHGPVDATPRLLYLFQ